MSGLLAAGVIVGIVYALVVESRRSRQSGRWQEGLSRLAVGFIIAAGLSMWVGITIAIMWPVLDANYRGLPTRPGHAGQRGGTPRRIPGLCGLRDPPLSLARITFMPSGGQPVPVGRRSAGAPSWWARPAWRWRQDRARCCSI